MPVGPVGMNEVHQTAGAERRPSIGADGGRTVGVTAGPYEMLGYALLGIYSDLADHADGRQPRQ